MAATKTCKHRNKTICPYAALKIGSKRLTNGDAFSDLFVLFVSLFLLLCLFVVLVALLLFDDNYILVKSRYLSRLRL